MKLSIVERVSQIITEKRHNVKIAKKVDSGVSKTDKVEISDLGSSVKSLTDYIVNLPDSPEREEKVANIKQSVEAKTYQLSSEAVDVIAERIAGSLI